MSESGDNAQRHERRWNGFANWWSEVFGAVRFGDQSDEGSRTVRRRADPAAERRAAQPAGQRVDSGHRRRRAGVPDRLADPAQLSGSRCVLRAGRPAAASPIRWT